MSEANDAARESATKAKAAHDSVMDRITGLAPYAEARDLRLLSEAFKDALTILHFTYGRT